MPSADLEWGKQRFDVVIVDGPTMYGGIVGKIKQWWANELSLWVKFVFLVLMANGVPAFIILMSVPNMTEILFV